jgi:FtsP/CotA-like multicopper oxidase with cupredoxin domain
MGITRLNVVAGLAGMYLLRDQYDTGTAANTLGLPNGEFEMPLIIADRRFNDDGSLRFHTVRWIRDGRWEGGMFGDLITVNGTVHPRACVARGMYRFRVLNASNSRQYQLSFSNRTRFWVVGNDSGLLDQPAFLDEVALAPGDRLDIVADFTGLYAGDTVDLMNSYDYGNGPPAALPPLRSPYALPDKRSGRAGRGSATADLGTRERRSPDHVGISRSELNSLVPGFRDDDHTDQRKRLHRNVNASKSRLGCGRRRSPRKYRLPGTPHSPFSGSLFPPSHWDMLPDRVFRRSREFFSRC